MKNLSSLLILIILFNPDISLATIRLVPSQYASIQSALTACQASDTVKVSSGTYHENIFWPNTFGIKLLAGGNISSTIVDGNGSGSVFSFSFGLPSQVDNTTQINGFTIRNGHTTSSGAAFYLYYAGPTISHCMITGNVADGGSSSSATGGIIYSQLGDLVIKNCKFTNNSSINFEYGGGLIFAGNGSLQIRDCVFLKNKVTATTFIEGGIIRVDGCTTNIADVVIKNNTISITNDLFTTYNGGILKATSLNTFNLTNVLIAKNSIKRSADVGVFGGICYIYVPSTFMNVTIAKNKMENENSIVYGKCISAYEEVNITNSILWNPADLPGNEIDGSPVVSYSDVRGGFPGTGNIDTDPQFISTNDFHLQLTSPCIDAGTNTGAPPADLDGNIRPSPPGTHPDMGCYEMKQELQLARLEGETQLGWSVYPNPAAGIITIKYNSDHEAVAQIIADRPFGQRSPGY